MPRIAAAAFEIRDEIRAVLLARRDTATIHLRRVHPEAD